MKIKFSGSALPRSGTLVLFLAEGKSLAGLADKADRACKGQIARALAAAAFTGRRDSSLDILAPGGGLGRVVVFGLGDPAKLTSLDVEMLGGAVAGTLQSQKAKAASVAADVSPKGLSEADFAALIGSGARLRVYSFGHYKSKKPEIGGLADLTILSSDAAAANRHYRPLEAVAEGVHLARDLVN